MNRRIIISILAAAFLLYLAVVAFPVQSATPRGVRLQGTGAATEQATADPCNPTYTVPGTVLSNIFVYDRPDERFGRRLILLMRNDVVEVLARNETGFWVLVRTNWGITGWAVSPQVSVDKKQWANPTTVPINKNLTPLPTPTLPATMAATAQAADPLALADCVGVEGVVAVATFDLRSKPITTAPSTEVKVKNGDRVTIAALNADGSWVLVRTENGGKGWITAVSIAYPAKALAGLRRDYSFLEATITPGASK